jgi:Uma2 family endonuclease
MNKFPIFAGIGIAEVWRYSNGQLRIYRLRRGEYQEQPASEELPRVTSAKLTAFLEASSAMDKIEWIEQVQAWVRANR